jgi:hypothetical protein
VVEHLPGLSEAPGSILSMGQKKKKALYGRERTSVVEILPNMYKAMSLIPSTVKKQISKK